MLREALHYLSLGFSVIPLRPNAKEPLISWQEFQSRRASESELREWFQKWPNANLGIVTGLISGVVVVDLDGPEGLSSAVHLNLTSSVQSLTGNGKHLWYSLPKDGKLIANAVRILPGIDIRGEAGYVVAPPSIHESGKRYRWLGALNAQTFSTLTSFPVKMFVDDVSQTKKFEQKEEGWIAKALEEMKDGNIDNTLTSVLGRLRRDGYSASDAEILLKPHADSAGAEEGHLEAKIENIWTRYEPKYTISNLRPSSQSNQPEGLIIHSPTNPDSIKQFEQARSAVDNAGEAGLPTGYSKLDTMLQGGLKSSRLFTVAARTGVGKTNWLLGVAKHLCRSGKRVLLFSTEMPFSQIWERYVATLENPEEFKTHEFHVCDSFAPNIEKVEVAINAIKPDVFMFDHINHVSEEVKGLGEFMQGLNYLRRKYDTAGIVTAQLNRAADWIDLKTGEKVTPRMSMVKGSGTIEQASSRVLLLSETRITPEGTEIVGNLDKNDNGPRGMCHFMLYNNPYKMEQI